MFYLIYFHFWNNKQIYNTDRTDRRLLRDNPRDIPFPEGVLFELLFSYDDELLHDLAKRIADALGNIYNWYNLYVIIIQW
jgi:hypothetical protein